MTCNPVGPLVVDVITKMSEPHRHYHSYVAHIDKMIDVFNADMDDINVKIAYKKSIWLAIMFHDYVYSTELSEYKNNEELSRDAMYLKTWNLCEFTNEDRHVAAMMITATKTHSVDGIDADPDVIDAIKYFLDLDLMIFCGTINEIMEYEDGIRNEFCQYPDSIYYPERIRILEKFLDRESIYMHPSNSGRNTIAVTAITNLIASLHEYYMKNVYK